MERVKIERFIRKPAQAWSNQIHAYLNFLGSAGSKGIPIPLGFDDNGNELLTYVKGKTCDYPLSEIVKSETTLISAANFLRDYHSISEKYVKEALFPIDGWMFPAKRPVEIICHNDFAPYNICFSGSKVIGLIDFEAAIPGPKIWDVAYALYRFAPFTNPYNEDGFGNFADKCKRAKLFCDIYELNNVDRNNIANVMIERLEALNKFLLYAANNGDAKYQACISDGHHKLYEMDIEYINNNKQKIIDNIYTVNFDTNGVATPIQTPN